MTRTRTRSGCLTCRSRKRKCDNVHPTCESCKTRSLTCQWGLKASFHPSRQLELTDHERQRLAHLESRRQRFSSATFVDSTKHIYRYFQDGDVTDNDLLLSLDQNVLPEQSWASSVAHQPLSLGYDTGLGRDDDTLAVESALVVQSESQVETPSPEVECIALLNTQGTIDDHSLPGTGASLFSSPEGNAQGALPDATTTAPTPDTALDIVDESCYNLPFSLGLALAHNSSRVASITPWTEPEYPLNESETLDMLQSFFVYTATWCETTDTSRTISVVFAHDIVAHKICMAAALALTCWQRSVFDNSYKETALKLYQYTIKLLIRQDPDHADPLVLTACILLCVYEMISADVADWRRHLKGCAGLFVKHGWGGSSTGLTKACFWAFARIDIWASFVSENETLIPTRRWVNDDSLERAASMESPDDYCNLSIVAFARTINCIVRLRSPTIAAPAYDEAVHLCGYLRHWWDFRPKQVYPVIRSPRTAENAFPRTIFASPAAICGNTFYHCAAILLLDILNSRTSRRPEKIFRDPHNDPIFHSREIGGISTSNHDHANWVNHLQPLYIAGQSFAENDVSPSGLGPAPRGQKASQGSYADWPQATRGNASLKYSAEKFALLKHLQVIQSETGWKTDERARELRQLWGLQ